MQIFLKVCGPISGPLNSIAATGIFRHLNASSSCRRLLLDCIARAVLFYTHLFSIVQVIMATNRADTLDPALLRPGRLDRKIEFPLPDRRQKRLVFQTITSKMNLSDESGLGGIYCST